MATQNHRTRPRGDEKGGNAVPIWSLQVANARKKVKDREGGTTWSPNQSPEKKGGVGWGGGGTGRADAQEGHDFDVKVGGNHAEETIPSAGAEEKGGLNKKKCQM